jgi:hypothetical protein
MLRHLRHRFRIWRLRRMARYWYEESIAHRKSEELHRQARWRCLNLGNDSHQQAQLLESESKA